MATQMMPTGSSSTAKDSSRNGSAQRPTRPLSLRKRRVHESGLGHDTNHAKISTGRYDMSVLRELARTEEAALGELVSMYKVEAEENIPVSFDIHQLLTLGEAERRPFLDNLLKGCPATEEVPVFVEKYVGHIKGLNPRL